jgi:hypothetical protein
MVMGHKGAGKTGSKLLLCSNPRSKIDTGTYTDAGTNAWVDNQDLKFFWLYYPEDEGSKFLRTVGNYLQHGMTSRLRK